MKRYVVTYDHAYGIDHMIIYANSKAQARKSFNASKPIAGAKIVEIEES
jgi:hypothetical protein